MYVKLDSSWGIVIPKDSTVIIQTSAEDLKSFISKEKGLDLKIVKMGNLKGIKKAIVICLNGTASTKIAEIDKPESFKLEITEEVINIFGADDRGAMYGTFYLEDLLSFSKDLSLEKMSVIKKPLIKYRIATVTSANFTDDELAFLTHSGVNCLQMFHFPWMELLTPSKMFPEDGELIKWDEEVVNVINEVFNRAQKYGMDCYLFVRGVRPSIKHLGAFEHRFYETAGKIFEKFPDVRGSNMGILDPIAVRGQSASWSRETVPLCFSSKNLQRFIRETCQNLYKNIPNLKGMIVEPFDGTLWCDDTCDACRGKPVASRIAEYIKLLSEAAKSVRKDAKVLLYHWGFPLSLRNERDKLISEVPKDAIILNAYTDGIEQIIDGEFLHHGGFYDITVNVSSPGKVYLKDCEISKKSEHEFVTWMTAGSSNEFKGAPYIPAPYNIAKEIFDSLKAGGDGLFEHGGPDHCIGAEVYKWAVWEPEEKVYEILEKIANRDYGEKAASKMIEAWRQIGNAANKQPVGYYYLQNLYITALAPLFPAEDAITFLAAIQRKVNLSQLDKMLHVGTSYLRQLIKFFDLTADGLNKGFDLLEEALNLAEHEKHKANIQAEINMTKACMHIVRGKVNFLKFLVLLMEKETTSKPWAMEEIAQIMKAQIENVKQLKDLVEKDSRIGYNMWEGWIFNSENLGKTILAMEIQLAKIKEKGLHFEYINAWR